MRRTLGWAALVVGATFGGGSARAQAPGDGTFAGPTFGYFPQPSGLYTSMSIPGMGRGWPSLMLYVPATGSGVSPTNVDVTGLRLPVAGTGGSVYVPNSPALPGPVAGGGLGLPNPPRPATTPAAARPAATTKAAAKTKAETARSAEPDTQAEAKSDGKSTLRARRGIR